MKFIDRTGQVFNYLKFLEFSHINNHRTNWKVECLLCGKIVVFSADKIVTGHTKSCGCLKRIDSKLFCQKRIFEQYVNWAKQKNLSFELVFEEFIKFLSKPCYLCGDMEIAQYKHPRKPFHTLKYNGIDRIDSSQGYTLDNCITCCKTCNWMKNDLSFDEFFTQVIKIVQKQAANISNKKGL